MEKKGKHFSIQAFVLEKIEFEHLSSALGELKNYLEIYQVYLTGQARIIDARIFYA